MHVIKPHVELLFVTLQINVESPKLSSAGQICRIIYCLIDVNYNSIVLSKSFVVIFVLYCQ